MKEKQKFQAAFQKYINEGKTKISSCFSEINI